MQDARSILRLISEGHAKVDAEEHSSLLAMIPKILDIIAKRQVVEKWGLDKKAECPRLPQR
jgi:hypothetical protein